jgi:hypothetical protein
MALSSFSRSGLSRVSTPAYATVTSPTKTGQFSVGAYTWDYWDFTSNGTLTTSTDGFLDILVVGAGGNGASLNSGRAGGGGGAVRYGHFIVTTGSYTVTVGAAGGNASSFGSVLVCGGGVNATYVSGIGSNYSLSGGGNGGHGAAFCSGIGNPSADGAGAGGSSSSGGQGYSGISLNYNNSTIEYGRGGFSGMSTVANSGNGGYTPAAQAGRVIVRVRV